MGYALPEPEQCAKCDAAIRNADDLCRCAAKGCARDVLCIGCAYHCQDCERDFCLDDIRDANANTPASWALYLCRDCYDGRQQEDSAAWRERAGADRREEEAA
jgi:hypothetical protein